jgi:hypothetical protein
MACGIARFPNLIASPTKCIVSMTCANAKLSVMYAAMKNSIAVLSNIIARTTNPIAQVSDAFAKLTNGIAQRLN